MFVFSALASFAVTLTVCAQTNVADESSNRATKSMQLVGNDLFIAAFGWGVHVLDVSDPLSPKWKGGWNPRRCPMGIQVVGNFAFVADRIAGLTVLDVSNSANPVWVTTVDTPGDAYALHVVGTKAYVADGRDSGLLVFDVSKPREPKLIKRCETAYGARGVQVVGETAYVNCGNQVQLLNISDLENPFAYARCNVQVFAEYSQVVGSLHFTCGGNIFSSQSGMFLGKYPGGSSSVFVRGKMIFAATRTGGFSIVDVSDSAEPKLLSNLKLSTNQQNDVVVANQIAYVSDGGANIRVIDFKNPHAPKVVGFFPSTHYSSGVLSLASAGKQSAKKTPLIARSESVESHRFESHVSAEPSRSPTFAVSPVPPSIVASAITNAPPELNAAQKAEDGTFSFILEGVPNATYVIQVSNDLKLWASVATNFLPSTGALRIIDPQASTFSQRYYRAMIQP
ncbi:MAG: hypothetical protein ABIQ35_12525 [Verrucomicrobiota bacterium]